MKATDPSGVAGIGGDRNMMFALAAALRDKL